MRDDLVGYCLGALDAPDAKRVESALADPATGQALRRDLDAIRRATLPLAADRDPIPAPPGLAARTLLAAAKARGAVNATVTPIGDAARAAAADSHRPAREQRGHHERHRPAAPAFRPVERGEGGNEAGMSWIDTMLLAATALAASILLMPALASLVQQSRHTKTDRNMVKIGNALHGYVSSHRRYPSPPDGGPMSRGGLYAPMLVSEHRIAADDGTFLTPGSVLARSGTFRVPTIQSLEASRELPSFDELVRTMGGDFGYTLGHRDPMGNLQPIRGLHRSHHPVMADAPDESGERSDNHPDGLHHFLWEDGRVGKVHESGIHFDDDHVYRNHDGVIAAGKDEEDAVIGASHHQP